MRSWQRHPVFRQIVTGTVLLGAVVNAVANPEGLTVSSGSASLQQSGPQLTITASQNALLDWQSFNIAPGETTTFNQPSAASIVWNRINDPNPSQIWGHLNANGVVVLMNQSGFFFGPGSVVNTAGFVATTAMRLPVADAGGNWQFNGPPPTASIVNYGEIKVNDGGSLFLLAEKIENHGVLTTPDGTLGLYAGKDVLMSERPDGRGLSMKVSLPSGSVDNNGKLIADGGTIALSAQVVNQSGLIQANSVREQNGIIELVAADQINLGSDSHIIANGGDSIGGSKGGTVTLKSENNFTDQTGSQISVAGGAQGGNGGSLEISAPNMLSLDSGLDARAQPGWSGGAFLLDPVNILLGTSTAGGAINVNTAFAGFSTILLQASGNISLNANTTWNLSASTGQSAGQLTLEAGGDITLGNNSKILDANNWAVTLDAGYNSSKVQPGIGNIFLNGGSGLNTSGSIQTAAGNIDLAAGQSILVGAGYAITTGGGSITAHALMGNIGTGSFAQGYHFALTAVGSLDQAYDLSGGLGGISTAAGGNVSLTAGGNVSSVLPGNKQYFYNGNTFTPNNGNDFTTAGAGAYGRQAGQIGNVTVVAGGNVTGHYLVANGTGGIYAGVMMDANGNPETDSAGNYVLGASGSAGTDNNKNTLALSLVSGGWNVAAAQNILLQEVRNPNGIFDINKNSPAYKHYFDYAPGDYVNLSAGNQVQLGAASSSLPRVDTLNVPVIYPSILNIAAGAGGVVFNGDFNYSQLILFPSPQGSLTINTTQGGSLTGNLPLSGAGGAPQIFNLVVSDSSAVRYQSSGDFSLSDHATTPVHLDNPTPIVLNISGNMQSVLLGAPEAAQITIGGDMINSRFQGMNLSDVPDDPKNPIKVPVRKIDGSIGEAKVTPATTSINVAGDIINRSAFTSIDLNLVPGAQAPDFSSLLQAVSGDPSPTTLAASFYYDPATKVLTYQNIPGRSLDSILQLLQNLPVQVYLNGVPQWTDPPDNLTPLTTTVAAIDAATAQALLAQYNALGGTPSGAFGYTLGGGGQFNLSARSLDLGTTAGIQSKGVSLYKVGASYPLASLFTQGADVSVTTTGDLDMYSSSIATLNGGNISINAGGELNAGSSVFSVTTLGARGIYSTSGGDVSVYSGGDINLNGSRIATYDGGNLTVESRHGNINAGSGASLPVTVAGYFVDPATRSVYNNNPQIPFSGILALTFPGRDDAYPAPVAKLGNILVETPNGSINANVAGILQIPLNNVNYPDALTTVLAGFELRDRAGNPVTAADLANGTPVAVSDNRDINTTGSGIIASNAKLNASGGITGFIFARNNIDLSAQQNVNVTALGAGSVSVSSGGSISGTIVGVGGVSASGASVDASLISANVTGATGGQSGLGQGTAANATSQAASSDDAGKPADKPAAGGNEDELKKKKPIALAQKVSRVTVILPAKN